MTYPATTFSSYNQSTYNGAKEYAIWRHLAPGNCYCAGYAYKTRHGIWFATVTNSRGVKRDFDAPKFRELRGKVLAFMA